MTIAVTGPRPSAGAAIAEINLKLIWDVISTIHIGKTGNAFVLDRPDHLVAHPDISLVLRGSRPRRDGRSQKEHAKRRYRSGLGPRLAEPSSHGRRSADRRSHGPSSRSNPSPSIGSDPRLALAHGRVAAKWRRVRGAAGLSSGAADDRSHPAFGGGSAAYRRGAVRSHAGPPQERSPAARRGRPNSRGGRGTRARAFRALPAIDALLARFGDGRTGQARP